MNAAASDDAIVVGPLCVLGTRIVPREVAFSLADGTVVTRKAGNAYFEINGSLGPAPVIFGEEGDEPLLGATTLESLGLIRMVLA